MEPKHVAAISAASRIDVKGFDHVMDTAGVVHIFRRHGNRRIEQLNGRGPIKRWDIARYRDVLAAGKFASERRQSGRGTNIAMTSAVGGWTYHVVLEVRRSTRQVALKSMRKSPKR